MKGDISCRHGLEPYLIVRCNDMTPQQFELMRAQLKSLTPQQLRTLRGEINSKLDANEKTLVTDEELSLICSLFS